MDITKFYPSIDHNILKSIISRKILVSDMYHTEGGRKYSGEKFDIHKAKEICERYKGVIPVSATPKRILIGQGQGIILPFLFAYIISILFVLAK